MREATKLIKIIIKNTRERTIHLSEGSHGLALGTWILQIGLDGERISLPSKSLEPDNSLYNEVLLTETSRRFVLKSGGIC